MQKGDGEWSCQPGTSEETFLVRSLAARHSKEKREEEKEEESKSLLLRHFFSFSFAFAKKNELPFTSFFHSFPLFFCLEKAISFFPPAPLAREGLSKIFSPFFEGGGRRRRYLPESFHSPLPLLLPALVIGLPRSALPLLALRPSILLRRSEAAPRLHKKAFLPTPPAPGKSKEEIHRDHGQVAK